MKVKPQPLPSLIIISNGDDWEGLYIDGKLVCEDHRLSPRAVLGPLGLDLTLRYVSSEYLGYTVSHLPEKLADIPVHAFQD